MDNDFSYKLGLNDSLIAGLQRKAQIEQAAAAEAKQQEQAQWIQVADSTSKAISNNIEFNKQKQKRDFIATLADSLASQTTPNQGTALVNGQPVQTASFDPVRSDTIRSAVQADPAGAAQRVFKTSIEDPIEREKLDLAREKLTAQKEKGGASDDKNYVRQLFEINGKPYAVLGRVDKKGNPIVVPVGTDEGERNPFVKPTLSAEATAQLADFESISGFANELMDTTDDNLKKWVGPINAKTTKALQYTPKADPDAAKFYQQLQDVKNQIIYLRSGKQINEQEYKRLAEAMPNETKNVGVFKVQLKKFIEIFNETKANRQKALAKGYRAVSPAAAGTEIKSASDYSAMPIDDLLQLLEEDN